MGFPGNSAPTLLAALVGSIALILAPFTEEPWLQGIYGRAYTMYRRFVPRFVHLSPRLGCVTVLLLCGLAVFGNPLWAFASASLPNVWWRFRQPKLRVELVSNLGEISQVEFSPNGKRFLTRSDEKFDDLSYQMLATYKLFDVDGNLVAEGRPIRLHN
jgi:hypothetical protein